MVNWKYLNILNIENKISQYHFNINSASAVSNAYISCNLWQFKLYFVCDISECKPRCVHGRCSKEYDVTMPHCHCDEGYSGHDCSGKYFNWSLIYHALLVLLYRIIDEKWALSLEHQLLCQTVQVNVDIGNYVVLGLLCAHCLS